MMAPIIAKITPVEGTKELAPLHRSLVQVQIPVSFLQSISMFFVPHPLEVSAGES